MAQKKKKIFLDRIGVVLDAAAHKPSEIVRAIIAQYRGEGSIWRVHTEGSREFRANVFLLAHLAMTRLGEQQQAPRGNLILARQTDNEYGFLAQYMADLKTRAEERGGRKTSADLKDGLINTFPTKGWKPKVEISCLGRIRPDSFFFVTQDEYVSEFGMDPMEGQQLSVRGYFRGPSPRIAAHLTDLVQKVYVYAAGGRLPRGATWIDLYESTLREMGRKELSEPLIDLSLVPQDNEPTSLRYSRTSVWQHTNRKHQAGISIREAFERYRSLLITGGPGSGKTTLAHSLLLALVRENASRRDSERWVPFFIGARYLGPGEAGKSGDDLLAEGVAHMLTRHASGEMLLAWRGLSQRERDLIASGKLGQADVVARIRVSVLRWLQKQKPFTRNIAVIIDGLNETPHDSKGLLSSLIGDLLTTNARVVITSQPISDVPVSNQLFRAHVRELTNKEIQRYLEDRFPRRGSRMYSAKLEPSPAALGLSRIPFFLSLVADELSEGRGKEFLPVEASVLSRFIEACHRRKLQEGAGLPAIRRETRDRFLEVLAGRIVGKITDRGGRHLSYPIDVEGVPAGGHALDRLVDFCETMGVITVVPASVGTMILFSHDYFLWFFAGRYLASLGENLTEDLGEYLEYPEWDMPFMYAFQHMSDPQFSEKALQSVMRFCSELALICAVRANINTEMCKRIAIACSQKEDGPGAPVSAELDKYATSALPQLLACLSADELARLGESEEDLWPHIILATPYVHCDDALGAMKRIQSRRCDSREVKALLARATVGLVPNDAWEFLLGLVDDIETSGEAGDWSILSGIHFGMMIACERAGWGVLEVWKHVTSYHRKQVIGSALALICLPSAEDVPVLEQILMNEDTRTARQAAILLVEILGIAALPRIRQSEDRRQSEPGAKKRRSIGMKGSSVYESYDLLKAIAELHHEEAERFLLDDVKIEALSECGPFVRQPFLTLAPIMGTRRAFRRLVERLLAVSMFCSDIECSSSDFGLLYGERLQSVREVLDALGDWPEKEIARQFLHREFQPWESSHRLLAACLGDADQKAFVIEVVRKGRSEGWYAERIQDLSNDNRRRNGQAVDVEARLGKQLSQVRTPKDFEELLSHEYGTYTALRAARRQRNELIFAARGARVLHIGEIATELRMLAEHVTAKTTPLYLEALAASVALSTASDLEWVLQELGNVPDSVARRDELQKRVADYYVANTGAVRLVENLPRLYNEFLELLIDEHERPNKDTYIVHLIQEAVRSRPSSEKVVAVVKKLRDNYQIVGKSKDEHMESGFLFLLQEIQLAAARRFLDVKPETPENTKSR